MCNGSSLRTSRGGTIAVLHPTASSPAPSYSLLFSAGEPGSTRAVFQAPHRRHVRMLERGCWVVIHKTGDLTPSNAAYDDTLYRFPLEPIAAEEEEEIAVKVPAALDLSVGGAGVVGRKVSLMVEDGGGAEREVASGVIGWN